MKKKWVKRLVIAGAVVVGLPAAFVLFVFGAKLIHDHMPVQWLPEGEIARIDIRPTETHLYSSAGITGPGEIAEIVAMIREARLVKRIRLPYVSDFDFDQSDRWLHIDFIYADGSAVALDFPYGWQVVEKRLDGEVARSQQLPALKELLMSYVAVGP